MKKLFLPLAFLLLLSGVPAPAQAQTFCQGGSCTYIPLEPLPGLPNSYGPNAGSGSFPELISKSFQLLLGAGAAIAVVMLIIGALTYMFSDVITDKFKAKERIRNTMWAIVLLVSSYLILNTINPDLVTFKLNLSALNSSGTSGGAQPTPQQSQEAINNSKIQQCLNGSSTTRLCTIHYPQSGDNWECLCSNF